MSSMVLMKMGIVSDRTVEHLSRRHTLGSSCRVAWGWRTSWREDRRARWADRMSAVLTTIRRRHVHRSLPTPHPRGGMLWARRGWWSWILLRGLAMISCAHSGAGDRGSTAPVPLRTRIRMPRGPPRLRSQEWGTRPNIAGCRKEGQAFVHGSLRHRHRGQP